MGRRLLKDIRREEIAQGLYRCLLQKPFFKTTIKDIAREAGINHGMLHYYFKNKEEILLFFLDWIVEKHIEAFREWSINQNLDTLPFEKALELSLAYVKESITLNDELAKIFIEIWEIALYHKKVKAKLQYVYTQWIQQFMVILRKKTDVQQATTLAVSTIAFLEGISLFRVMVGDIYPIPEILDYFEKKIETIISA